MHCIEYRFWFIFPGKFPHLLISTSEGQKPKSGNIPSLDFGCIRVHEIVSKAITLHNLSQGSMILWRKLHIFQTFISIYISRYNSIYCVSSVIIAVRVPFRIHLSSFTPYMDRAFSCSIIEGTVGPKADFNIPVIFILLNSDLYNLLFKHNPRIT